MLIKDTLYFIYVILIILSVPTYYYVKKNNNLYTNDYLKIMCLFPIIYYIVTYILVNDMYIEFGLEIMIFWVFLVTSGITYLTAYIKCKSKAKKLKVNKENKTISNLAICMIVIPIGLLVVAIVSNMIIVKRSNMVLFFNSRGNGGFGDSEEFAYAISNNSCKRFDYKISISGYMLREEKPSDAIEIRREEELNQYNYKYNISKDNILTVYSGDTVICNTKLSDDFFNIDFESGIIYKK